MMDSICWRCRWGQPMADQRPQGPPTWIICRYPGVPEPIGTGGENNEWPEVVVRCNAFVIRREVRSCARY